MPQQRLRTLSHAENELQVKPGPLLGSDSSQRQRRVTVRLSGSGAGVLRLPDHPREQRVLVKPTVVKPGSARGGNWYKHGTYLQREGVQGAGRGVGFDADSKAVRVSTTLGQWQREGDPRLFKVIVSPEKDVEMMTFVRRLIAEKIEPDLGRTVEWVAIEHRNTRQRHAHLLIRGRDADGRELRIDERYLWGGLPQRARELATQMLGWRTRDEIERERTRAVTARSWTALDRSLSMKRHGRTVVVDEIVTPHERARLAELGRRGLAWRDGADRWELSDHWEARAMSGLEQKHQQEQDLQQERERRQEEQERLRRARIIDQLEQEQGLER
jgi:hypothetical protein